RYKTVFFSRRTSELFAAFLAFGGELLLSTGLLYEIKLVPFNNREVRTEPMDFGGNKYSV
ncbi:MAG: hypothetical protein ACI9US_004228, partial [Gammaproteobacteria bacterium]